MGRTVWRLAATVVLVVLGAAACRPAPNAARPDPTAVPSGALIAFISDRDGGDEIYTMRRDGSEVLRVTNNTVTETGLAWSPDRVTLAYATVEDPDIYTIQADGTLPARLTQGGHSRDPAWSPDGAQIVYVSTEAGDAAIMRMDADGLYPVALAGGPTDDTAPAWSPDGARIAFVSAREDGVALVAMDADGANVTPVAPLPGPACCVTWSPDGSRIAVVVTVGDAAGLYVAGIDSGGASDLRLIAAGGAQPAWSPDGSRLAYVRPAEDGDGSVLEALDGDRTLALTGAGAQHTAPDWSPDGAQIVLASDEAGTSDIVVLDVFDAGRVITHPLTEGDARDRAPRWQP